MQHQPAPQAPAPLSAEMAEILRQSLTGLTPGDPMAHFLDRLEGRK